MENNQSNPTPVQPQPAAEQQPATQTRPQAQILEEGKKVLLPPDEQIRLRLDDYQRLLLAAGILPSENAPNSYAERHTLRVGAYYQAQQQAQQAGQPLPDGFADVEFLLQDATAAQKYNPQNWAFIQAWSFYDYMQRRRTEVLATQEKEATATKEKPNGPQLPNNRAGRKKAEQLAGKAPRKSTGKQPAT